MKLLNKKPRLAALMLLPILLVTSFVIACGETVTETVIQTVVVEKEVIVQKEGETVVQTVVVEKKSLLRSSRQSSSRRKSSSRKRARPSFRPSSSKSRSRYRSFRL